MSEVTLTLDDSRQVPPEWQRTGTWLLAGPRM